MVFVFGWVSIKTWKVHGRGCSNGNRHDRLWWLKTNNGWRSSRLILSCANGRTVDGACEQRGYGREDSNNMLVISWGRDDDMTNDRWQHGNMVVDGVFNSLWCGDTWRELRMWVCIGGVCVLPWKQGVQIDSIACGGLDWMTLGAELEGSINDWCQYLQLSNLVGKDYRRL